MVEVIGCLFIHFFLRMDNKVVRFVGVAAIGSTIWICLLSYSGLSVHYQEIIRSIEDKGERKSIGTSKLMKKDYYK